MESSRNMHSEHHHRQSSGILKNAVVQPTQCQHTGVDHVKFDEEVIAEHDKHRGTRQKITEPKTPYAQDEDQEEMMEDKEHQQTEDVQMHEQYKDHHTIEEEVKKHLEEAERNKLLNAQLQKEQNIMSNIQQSNFHDQLNQRLDQTQQELDEDKRKHQEFLKKRKEHYKNEMKAAMLLKKQSFDEEDDGDGDDNI